MKIQILMSTYNGEEYIRTQLDSIVNQTIEEKKLLIRDDGSIDNTVLIIQEYQKLYPWIEFYQGSNIGVQRSFFDLLEHSDSKADYIAFADQDDKWLPEKLECAVKKLKELFQKTKQPLLYCGSQVMVDEQLQPIDVTVTRIVKKAAFGNALVQNICTGCTAVINQQLAELIRNNIPKDIDAVVMHDWWLYLVASCFGSVYYDNKSYILYRQHEKNTHGAILRKRELIKYRIKQLTKPRGDVYRQVREFETVYIKILNSNNYEQKKKMINRLLLSEKKVTERLLIAINNQYFRQKRGDNLVFKLIILIGKL